MKKIFMGLLFILIFGLFGCSNSVTTISTTKEISSTTTNNYEELGYEYNMLEYSNPIFNVIFSNISFNIIQRQICFDFEITDYNSSYDYYFVYGIPGQTNRPFHRIRTSEMKATMKGYCLDLLENSDYISIEMGRISSNSNIIKEIPSNNSAGFRYKIADIASRKSINDVKVYFKSSATEYYKGIVSVIIEDPNESIDEIKISLSDVFLGFYHVTDKIISITPSMRNNGEIILTDIIFNNLSPAVRYQADVFINGNDGIYDFKNIDAGSSQGVTKDGYGIIEAYHGFYAEIHKATTLDGNTDIVVNVVNEGTYLIDNLKPELYLIFYHDYHDTVPYLSIPLENKENNIVLSNINIKLYDLIRVEDKAQMIILSNSNILPVE